MSGGVASETLASGLRRWSGWRSAGALRRLASLAVALLLLGIALAGLLAPRVARAVEWPQVQRVVSPLGIEAWLVENHAVPVIAMEFAFRGGIERDPPGKEGLSHLISTLLDEGAGDLDSATFQRREADAGIQLGFDAGVDAFFGSLATVTAQSGEAFDLLHLALTAPRFDADAVERMRAGVMADIRRRVADPDWLATRTLFETALPDHPYDRPSRGTAATLAGLTAEDLRGFVRTRFARDNLVIGVAGDITAAQLGEALDRIFGGLPANAELPDIADVAPSGGGQLVLVDRAGPQSVVLMAQPGIARDDPDYYAAYVLNHILGGGSFTSRLTRELRDLRGLTYGIGSQLVSFDHTNLVLVSSTMSNANVAEALEIIRREWTRIASDGVTQDELADARTFLTGSFPLRLTSTGRIAGTLRQMQLQDLGIDYLERRNALIEAVSRDDIRRVAARLLDPAALAVVVVGEPGEAVTPTRAVPAAAIATRELAGQGG